MDTARRMGTFLEYDLRLTDARYHELSAAFDGEYDGDRLFVGDSEIREEVVIVLCHIRKIAIFFSLLPFAPRYRLEEMVLHDTGDILLGSRYDTYDRDVRLRMEYMRPIRSCITGVLIAYDVGQYDRGHGDISDKEIYKWISIEVG
jgi:hypothetical protein